MSQIHTDMPPLAGGTRIGLLGGSFNPPHEGHRHISLEALRRLDLDRIWWLVTPGNPLKDNAELPALEERCKLAAAQADHPRIDITALEAGIGATYTATTIRHLVRAAPDTRFVWLMGGDNLANFHRWERWRDIAASVPIAILDRPGTRLKALASPAAIALERHRVPPAAAATLADSKPPAWTFLDMPLSHASSTELRRNPAQQP